MDEIVPFAETNFRNRQQRFGIKTDDRRRHMYVIGKTGMGKTTLLENMVIDDIRAGRGVAVVDPHGEFAEKMLNFVPKERVEDVIYFNPSDLNHPIAFNAVEAVAPPPYLYASDLRNYRVTDHDGRTGTVAHRYHGFGEFRKLQRYDRLWDLLPTERRATGVIGTCTWYLMDAQAVFAAGLAALMRDPLTFVDPT